MALIMFIKDYLFLLYIILNQVYLVSFKFDLTISRAISFVEIFFFLFGVSAFNMQYTTKHNVVLDTVFSGCESGIGSEYVSDNYI